MNEMQHIAFWVWWETGFNGHGERSFQRAAEQTGFSLNTLKKWHKEFHWDKIAAEKDAKTNRKFEQVVIGKIVKTFEEALDRQRGLIAAVYREFRGRLERMPSSNFKIADLVRLMEYETGWVFDEERGAAKENSLAIVLQMMPPEQRTEFNAVIERARDAGAIPFERMGSPSSN